MSSSLEKYVSQEKCIAESHLTMLRYSIEVDLRTIYMVVPMYLHRCIMISINKLTALRDLVYEPISSANGEKSQYAIPKVGKLLLGLAVHGREKEPIFRSNFFFFFLFLGKARLSPSAERFFLLIKISLGSCLSSLFKHFLLIMPITAGDAAPGAAMKAEITDYAKAMEVLDTYTTLDGLDADTLLDSDKHGALTYNDFLILPGYIGKPNPAVRFF